MSEDTRTAAVVAQPGSAEAAATLSIELEFTWQNTLPVYIELLTNATAEGQRYARLELERMACTADLVAKCIGLISELDEPGRHDEGKAAEVLATARTLASGTPVQVHAATPAADAPTARCGVLAKRDGGKDLPLEVCYSARGFYIGTCDDGSPYTRESEEYWSRREQAQQALDAGAWTQRSHS